MQTIKILGSGCANCKRLEAITRKVVEKHKIDAEILKVTDHNQIMEYPILATPGLVLDEKVLSSGRIPSESEIENWLLPTI
jgi:small redox-active disulfide protein 2